MQMMVASVASSIMKGIFSTSNHSVVGPGLFRVGPGFLASTVRSAAWRPARVKLRPAQLHRVFFLRAP